MGIVSGRNRELQDSVKPDRADGILWRIAGLTSGAIPPLRLSLTLSLPLSRGRPIDDNVPR